MGVWWEMIIGKSQWAYSTEDNVHLGKQILPNLHLMVSMRLIILR